MSHNKENKSRTSMWLVIGVIVLIVLLLVWLTVADFLGDTDVAAFINPVIQNNILLPLTL